MDPLSSVISHPETNHARTRFSVRTSHSRNHFHQRSSQRVAAACCLDSASRKKTCRTHTPVPVTNASGDTLVG
jgi:hypothetical protein